MKTNHLLKCWGCLFLLNLAWGSYIVLTTKTAFKKIEILICSVKFISPEVAVYLCKSIIWPCLEYYCHIWAVAATCYLDILDKLQEWVCSTLGPSLAGSLEPVSHCWDAARLSLFYSYYFGGCSSELAELVPLPHSCRRFTYSVQPGMKWILIF